MRVIRRAASAIRAATAVLAVGAIVIGLWGVFGSPSNAWRSVGDVVVMLMLVGLVAGYRDDIRRQLGRR